MTSKDKAIEAFGRVIEDKIELDSLCVTIPLVYKTDLSIIEYHLTHPTLDGAIKVVEGMKEKHDSAKIVYLKSDLYQHYNDECLRSSECENIITALKGLKEGKK